MQNPPSTLPWKLIGDNQTAINNGILVGESVRDGHVDNWAQFVRGGNAIGPAQLTLNVGNPYLATALAAYGFSPDQVRQATATGLTIPANLKAQIQSAVQANPTPLLDASRAQIDHIGYVIQDYFQTHSAQGIWASDLG